jgi:hypothetical protein
MAEGVTDAIDVALLVARAIERRTTSTFAMRFFTDARATFSFCRC